MAARGLPGLTESMTASTISNRPWRRLRDGALGRARVYLAVQKLLGADRLRRRCVDRLQPRDGERILDVGCGPGYILDYMPSVIYHGFDTNPDYIEYARRRFAGHGHFYCEEFTVRHLDTLFPVDAALLMGVLHHLPNDVGHAVVDLMRQVLAPAGRLITLDPCLEEGGSAIARYMATNDRGAYVRDRRGYLSLVSDRFARTEVELCRNVCRVPTTEIIMRCSGPVSAATRAPSPAPNEVHVPDLQIL